MGGEGRNVVTGLCTPKKLLFFCFVLTLQKYFLVSINILLILCCLVCAALSGYNTYLESVVFNLVGSAETPPSLGTIITGLEALLAVCILVLILVWNCVIVCSGVDSSPVRTCNVMGGMSLSYRHACTFTVRLFVCPAHPLFGSMPRVTPFDPPLAKHRFLVYWGQLHRAAKQRKLLTR